MTVIDPIAGLADRLEPRPDPYMTDPAGWVADRLGGFFWSKQVQIATSLANNRRTAVQSCHGVGKSASAARFAAWWLDVHPPGEAFVVSSAPTFAQVRAVLWREIGKVWRQADAHGHPLLGRVNQTEWMLGSEVIAFGRKPSDTDPTAFQGIHARYVLVLLDEAGGIPKDLWIAAGALATNDDCRILAIGNPDDPGSHFSEVCAPDSGWHVIKISAYDSPNFTGEPVPGWLSPLLVSPTWVDEMRSDVGEGSAPWLSKVLGEFPTDTDDAVVRLTALRACQVEQEWSDEQLSPVELGVDVGAGGDMTVIRERRGLKAGRVWRASTPEPRQVVDLVIQALTETEAVIVKIDSIGVGWGIAGRLVELGETGAHHARIVKVNVGQPSSRPDRFPRLRDQLWWEIGRQLSEQRGWDVSGIDERTVADLTAPKWAPDASGRVKVESKDETRKRIGRSTDDADALLLAFYAGAGNGGLVYDEIEPAAEHVHAAEFVMAVDPDAPFGDDDYHPERGQTRQSPYA